MMKYLVVLLALTWMAPACSTRPGHDSGGAGDGADTVSISPDQGTGTMRDTSLIVGDTTEVGHIK